MGRERFEEKWVKIAKNCRPEWGKNFQEFLGAKHHFFFFFFIKIFGRLGRHFGGTEDLFFDWTWAKKMTESGHSKIIYYFGQVKCQKNFFFQWQTLTNWDPSGDFAKTYFSRILKYLQCKTTFWNWYYLGSHFSYILRHCTKNEFLDFFTLQLQIYYKNVFFCHIIIYFEQFMS